MTGAKAWAAQVRGMGAYLEKVAKARDLDPDAFKPFYVPRFTDEQLRRQADAMRQIETALVKAAR